MPIRHLIALLFATLVAACGGGQANTDVSAGAATRIEIAPNAVLLTATGQKKSLAAKVFDAAGNSVQTQVEWTSSHPENIAVDASGAVTAISDGGSSQIIARIGTVQSPPLLAVHTQLPAGAVLLTDANIIGESEETTPGAVANIGNTYQVQLTGVPAPEVGSLLINTEGKVVGGRVQAVQTTNGVHRVTLALVPAREMFPQLSINEVIDLNQAEVAIPAVIQELYDVQRDGNTFTFSPKPDKASLTASLVQKQPMASSVVTSSSARTSRTSAATAPVAGGDFKLGPFVCKPALDGAAGAGSQIIALTIPPLFVITLNPKLDVLSTLANGLERFVVHAEPTASFEWGLKTLAAFEGKVTCDAELFTIRVPAGGPLALVIGGQIPIGVGVEVGGKITVASMTSTLKGVVKTTVDVGLACPGGTNCSVVKTFGPLTFSGVPTFDVPSLNDFRFEPTASAYTFVKASIGNPFLTSLRFDAFKVKAGAALKGNFAPQRVQTGDAQYSSDYKLVSELKAGADTGFTGLAGFLGLNAFAETVLEISADLGTTPIGTVSADVAQFSAGDTFNVAVKLDPKMTGFVPLVGPYNVDRIVLVRQDATGATGEVASVIARDGQTDFNFSLKATASGRTDEFFAFVVTRLLPTDVFSLELGRATSDAIPVVKLLDLQGGLSGTASAYPPLSGNLANCNLPANLQFDFARATDQIQDTCVATVAGAEASRTMAARYTVESSVQGVTRITMSGEAEATSSAIFNANADGNGNAIVRMDLIVEKPVLATSRFLADAVGYNATGLVGVSSPKDCIGSGNPCELQLQFCKTTATFGQGCTPMFGVAGEMPGSLLLKPGTYRFTFFVTTRTTSTNDFPGAKSGGASALFDVSFAPAP